MKKIGIENKNWELKWKIKNKNENEKKIGKEPKT